MFRGPSGCGCKFCSGGQMDLGSTSLLTWKMHTWSLPAETQPAQHLKPSQIHNTPSQPSISSSSSSCCPCTVPCQNSPCCPLGYRHHVEQGTWINRAQEGEALTCLPTFLALVLIHGSQCDVIGDLWRWGMSLHSPLLGHWTHT